MHNKSWIVDNRLAMAGAGHRSWRVTLRGSTLRWSDERGEYDSEPEASAGRRFQAWLARVLPVESQL